MTPFLAFFRVKVTRPTDPNDIELGFDGNANGMYMRGHRCQPQKAREGERGGEAINEGCERSKNRWNIGTPTTNDYRVFL